MLIVSLCVIILAGLLLPAMAVVRDSAASASCQGNLRQLGVANAMYMGDWRGYVMMPTPVTGLLPYFVKLEVYLGDTYQKSFPATNPYPPTIPLPPVWKCPRGNHDDPSCYAMAAAWPATGQSPDYGINWYVWWTNPNFHNQNVRPGDDVLSDPVNTIFITDRWGADNVWFSARAEVYPPWFYPAVSASTGPATKASGVRINHRGKFNAVFYDGHVQTLTPAESNSGVITPKRPGNLWGHYP